MKTRFSVERLVISNKRGWNPLEIESHGFVWKSAILHEKIRLFRILL